MVLVILSFWNIALVYSLEQSDLLRHGHPGKLR